MCVTRPNDPHNLTPVEMRRRPPSTLVSLRLSTARQPGPIALNNLTPLVACRDMPAAPRIPRALAWNATCQCWWRSAFAQRVTSHCWRH